MLQDGTPRGFLVIQIREIMHKLDQAAMDEMSLDAGQYEDPIRLSADRLKALADRIESKTVGRDCLVAILWDIAGVLSSIA
jgi:hypothetical protein